MKRSMLVLLVVFVLAACGGDPGGEADPTSTADTASTLPPTTVSETTTPNTVDDVDELPDPVCVGEGERPLPEFLGLTEEEARDLAAERGLTVREVGRDGECFPVTMDLRSDRVNLEFVGDVVVGAAIY
jgi:hypothetical protein